MYKEILALVLMSLFIILTSSYWGQALQWVLDFHDFLNNGLSYIFSDSKIGVVIAKLVSYLVGPFLISGVAAAGYAAVKRRFLPYFMPVTWVAWLIQTTALVLYT
jgi:hypothetical protein